MYDFMKRFCDIAEKGAREEDPLKLSRLLGQLEILAEICSASYKLEGLCEMLAGEMLKIQERLDQMAGVPAVALPALGMAEPKTVYKQEYVRCGKENCTRCTNRQGHGPYWYAYNFRDGKSHKRYIGLKLPEDLPSHSAEVRYALPLAGEPYCRHHCSRDGGEVKEPCCQLDNQTN